MEKGKMECASCSDNRVLNESREGESWMSLQTARRGEGSTGDPAKADQPLCYSSFPTHKPLASGLDCPGKKQSGGRRFNRAINSCNPYLRVILGEMAWCIARKPGAQLFDGALPSICTARR